VVVLVVAGAVVQVAAPERRVVPNVAALTVTYREDHSQVRTSNGPQVTAILGNLAIAIIKLGGAASIAAATRHYARNATRRLATLGLIPT